MMPVGIAVAAVSFTLSMPSERAQLKFCGEAEQMRDTNLPANDSTNSTDIVHAAVVYVEKRLAGFIYVTRNGSAWLQTGQINLTTHAAARQSDMLAALSVLRIPGTSAQNGTFYNLGSKPLGEAIGGALTIAGCY